MTVSCWCPTPTASPREGEGGFLGWERGNYHLLMAWLLQLLPGILFISLPASESLRRSPRSHASRIPRGHLTKSEAARERGRAWLFPPPPPSQEAPGMDEALTVSALSRLQPHPLYRKGNGGLRCDPVRVPLARGRAGLSLHLGTRSPPGQLPPPPQLPVLTLIS